MKQNILLSLFQHLKIKKKNTLAPEMYKNNQMISLESQIIIHCQLCIQQT